MDIRYGLVFRDEEDNVWLGIYEDSTIKEFGPLSDFEGVYESLPLSKFAFVNIKDEGGGRIWINDLHDFEMCKRVEADEDPNDPDVITITEFLKEINFPSEKSDGVFRTFLNESGKAN